MKVAEKYRKKIVDELTTLLERYFSKDPTGETYEIVQPLANVIVEAIEKVPRPKPVKGPSPGSKVWDRYVELKKQYWGVEPRRNAKTNAWCKTIVETIGESESLDLLDYYFTVNDAWLLKNLHPLGVLAAQCEQFWERKNAKKVYTRDQAIRMERAGNTAAAIQNYRKRGSNEKV